LWSNPRLEALARNPFLLSALALVHRAEGRLPRHRVQVYDAVAGALCETWGSARRLAAGETHIELAYAVEALPIIGRLARRMQEEASSGTQTAEWVLDTLAATLTADRGVTPGEARRVAFEFLTRASRDVPILVERGAGRWGFLHLTFQEFFATAGLHATDEFEEVARQHLFDPRWEEVTRLGVGYLALVQNRPRAAARFVEHVFRETRLEDRPWLTEVLGKHVRLAALLASEAGEALSPALAHEIAGEAARWALRVPERLARAFLAESVLGDFGALVAEALIAVLERGDAGARGRAANALGALRSPAATSLRSSEDSRAVGSLVEALEGADERVAVAAASALGMVGGKAAEAALVARLTDERNGVRAFCALALGLADATTAVPALANTTRDGDHVVRVLGGLALGLLKAEGILLEAIRDPDEHVRSGAVLGVGSLRDEVAVSALTAAAGDPSPEVRVNVASGLHRFVAPGDPVSLLALLADTNPVVRARAAASLGRVGGPLAHERLVTALRDSEAAVRAAAAQSIGMLRVGAAVDPLGALIDDPSPEVRSAAALALGELGAASVAARLASLLSDHHATVRAAAVQALGKIVAPDFMAGLRASMTDADASVRLAAARALATSDPEAAARMLVALTTDPAGAQDLRDSAFLALWDLAGSGEGTP
ncbi:MAG: HEAT repeat domain-containing protein, partial [Deltaproteobacteria bacterium]|nr:HEAT repeat domain-containing protein [Deltaproteobacteria bacterium]